jgi:hypothetical protein
VSSQKTTNAVEKEKERSYRRKALSKCRNKNVVPVLEKKSGEDADGRENFWSSPRLLL